MYSRDERKALESEEEPNRKREIVCGKKKLKRWTMAVSLMTTTINNK